MNYHIVTYGCQMNLHESEKIAGILKEEGYTHQSPLEEADIIVFNTCCIRENAENHAFGNIGALKKLKREKKGLIIAVGGCMVQEEGKAALLKQKFPFIDILFGTHNLSELSLLVRKKRAQKKAVIALKEAREQIEDGVTPVRTSYPNAWVNIMYGCNNFCSYCIVPYVRGREQSRAAEDILSEVKSLVAQGYKEITLLGQNVNSYCDVKSGMRFPQLLSAVAEIEGRFRVRFMTSHPKDFTFELIDVMKKHGKICRHLHLPVQSGSDRILKLMNRRYQRAHYLWCMESLRREIPDCAVTTDLIVGFPTETEEEFSETLSLVREADFASAFTFIYSPRTGTKAAQMEGQIPEEVSKERIMRLIELVNEKTREKSAECVGKTIEILCEDFDEKKGMYLGRDEYGHMGYFKSENDPIGEFVTLQITSANGISLYGEKTTINIAPYDEGEFDITCTTLRRYKGAGGEVHIPKGVTKIDCEAFAGSKVTAVVIPDTVTAIERRAFAYCKSLIKLKISKSVTRIGAAPVLYCESLKEIEVEAGNPVFESEGNCVIEKGTKTLVFGCNASRIPAGVRRIGRRAFEFCERLRDIVIPEGVEEIEDSAFYCCYSLFRLSLPHGLLRIGADAFAKSGLFQLFIPKSVEVLEYCFYDCESLWEIFCEAEKEPASWERDWAGNATVKWGCKGIEDSED